MQKLKLNWQEPLDFAQVVSENYGDSDWVFLYSGLSLEVKNSRSYIGLFVQEKIVAEDFAAAEKILKNSGKKWFGYLAYELGGEFEKLPQGEKSFVDLPKVCLVNFAVVLEFEHAVKKLSVSFENQEKWEQVARWTPQQVRGDNALALRHKFKVGSLNLSPRLHDGVHRDTPEISSFNSNFTNQSYLTAITDIKKMIAAGDFYQTNLTRKFFGTFTKKPTAQENFQLFTNLTKLSPANYSAFLKLDNNYVISSSPELFLKIKNGKIFSRPIKGTAPRNSDPKQDRKNKSNLKNSPKERAENLMIVDLVRNDLSRICEAGSVIVKKLFQITSYKNIHHMSSEIHGEITENFSAIDAVKACFPPGSMTGAPKIKAIETAAQKEKLNRGIYSGAIGYFCGEEINLSVVIRTLVLRGEKFEFQTGGAITFDSDAQAELAETFSKAKGIVELLGLNVE